MPLHQLPGRIVGSPSVAMSEQFVDVRIAVTADDDQLVAVELLDAGTPVGDDLAQLRQDQIEDSGMPSVLPSDSAAARSVSACSRAARSVSSNRAFSIAIAAWAANAVASSASSSL